MTLETSKKTQPFIFKLSKGDTVRLVKLRASNDALFTGRRNAAMLGWRAILKEMGLEREVSTDQAAKKWDNLKNKYKELRCRPAEEASTWQWFSLMHDAMEGRLKDSAPILSTSSLGDDSDFVLTRKRARWTPEKANLLDFLTNAEDGEGVAQVAEGNVVVTFSQGHAPGGNAGVGAVRRYGGGAEDGTRLEEGTNAQTFTATLEMERMGLRCEREQLEKEQAELDRERLMLEREKGLVERDRAVIERDRSLLEKDRAALDRERASLEQERAVLEKDRAALDREKEALAREREVLRRDLMFGRNTSSLRDSELTEPLERRDKFIYLFERLIEKL